MFAVAITSGLLTYDFTLFKSTHAAIAPYIAQYESCRLLVFVIVTSIATLLAVVDSAFIRPSVKTLSLTNLHLRQMLAKEEEKNQVLADNIKQVLDGYLVNLAKKIGFGKCEERLTLMVHDRSNGSFVTVARYAPNPSYHGFGCRYIYPDNQGAIASGWQSSWHFDERDASTEFVNYNNSKYGISKAILGKIRMRSSLYCAKRIEFMDKPIALVLFETTRTDVFKEDSLKSTLDEEELFIGRFITQLFEYIPMPSDAKGRGL